MRKNDQVWVSGTNNRGALLKGINEDKWEQERYFISMLRQKDFTDYLDTGSGWKWWQAVWYVTNFLKRLIKICENHQNSLKCHFMTEAGKISLVLFDLNRIPTEAISFRQMMLKTFHFMKNKEWMIFIHENVEFPVSFLFFLSILRTFSHAHIKIKNITRESFAYLKKRTYLMWAINITLNR